MAILSHQLSESLHLPGVAGVGAWARDLLSRFNAYRKERRNQAQILAHLSLADDRELRDLQISRYDFDAIAKGKFQR